MKRSFHLIYWTVISLFLFLVFIWISGNVVYSFYFLTFFLPVVMAAALLFTEKLIPAYLLKGKYSPFVFYSLAILVVSGNLLMVLSFVSLLLLGLYDPQNFHLIVDNFRQLPLLMFLVILFSGFVGIVRQYMKRIKAEGDEKPIRDGMLLVRSERRNKALRHDSILFIESMSDYVRIFLQGGERIITKERISQLEEKLPAEFLRIHRSYIINTGHLDSFSREEVVIKGKSLPVSRTYKTRVMEKLAS